MGAEKEVKLRTEFSEQGVVGFLQNSQADVLDVAEHCIM